MTSNDKDRLLRHAMRRAAGRDAFVASALATYQMMNHMDDLALARVLGCTVDDLPRAGLCLWPDGDAPSFPSDVQRIAEYAGVNAFALTRVLRDAAAIRRMRQVAGSGATMLSAARDAPVPAAELREERADYDPGHRLRAELGADSDTQERSRPDEDRAT